MAAETAAMQTQTVVKTTGKGEETKTKAEDTWMPRSNKHGAAKWLVPARRHGKQLPRGIDER